MKPSIKSALFGGRITAKRVALLGFFLAILITLKYAFGFVPGIELISFSFIALALMLPILDLTFLVVSFNLLVLAIYGFGTWWFAYWLIWPVDILITVLIAKFTKNRFVFGVWGFVASFSIMFYYFFSDWLFFGLDFAYLNIFSALPISLIGGFLTLFLMITVAPRLINVAAVKSTLFWPDRVMFMFSPVKYRSIGKVVTVSTSLLAVAGIVLLFVFNSFFTDLRVKKARDTTIAGVISERMTPLSWVVMDVDSYNNMVINFDDDDVGIVVIANGVFTKEVVSIYEDQTLFNAMTTLKTIEFKFYKGPLYGNFVNTFRKKGTETWLHGTSTSKVYNDHYPMYAWNNKSAPVGVDALKLKPHDVIEFTYDFGSKPRT